MIEPAAPIWLDPIIKLAFLLAGAAISYWSTRRFDTMQQKKKDNAVAYSIIFTLSGIANDLIQLNNIMVRISKTHFHKIRSGKEVWELLPMTFGWDQDRSFTHEQLALVAAMGEAELVTKLEEAFASHRLFVAAANRVSDLKMELAQANVSRRVEGDAIITDVTADQYATIFPIVMQLKTLAEKLAYDLPEAVDEAKEIASTIGPKLKSHFKFKRLATVGFVKRDGVVADEREVVESD